MQELTIECPCAKHNTDLGCGDGYTHCRGYVVGQTCFKGKVGERVGVSDGPRQADLRRLLCDDMTSHKRVDVIPIMHNPGVVILQLNGWSINLKEDGTWWWEATDGG